MRTTIAKHGFLTLVLGIICAAMALSPASAQAQKRLAFVIGNSAYENVTKLPNALNDANATRAVLQEAGFDVVPATDASLAALRSSLDEFIGKVAQAGLGSTALVYYAGHAVQLDGTNYLLPVDVRPQRSADVVAQAVSLSDILRRLDATGAVAKIVILDACRNNPFEAQDMARGLSLQLVDGASEGIRSEAGLARIDSKSGTFVAFATSPGTTAADGAGSNSPFTTALLRQIREPGLPVEQLFRRIRLDVHDATSGQQLPWDTSSLISDFAFFPQRPGTAQAPASTAQPADTISLTTRPTVAALRTLAPADAYRTAIAWDRPDIYRGFLEVQPDDERALRVHRILSTRTEETAWSETVRAGDAESFRLFARLYPGSGHVNEAVRLAASAPSRNRVIQAAATCPVCPALAPPRTRRADYTPRPTAPGNPTAVSPQRYAPARVVRRNAEQRSLPEPQAVAAPMVVPAAEALPMAEAPLFDRPRWTRFYLGGHLGGGEQTSRTRLDGIGPTRSVAVSIDAGNVPPTLNPAGSGMLGGVQAGFNVQTGAFVFGAETDIAATRLGGRKNITVDPFGVIVSTTGESELSYLGTVRGRVGVALGDFMLFGTAGYAYGRLEQSGSIVPDPFPNPTYIARNSTIAGGWTAGGGIEYALGPSLSLKLDYLHYDLGTRTLILDEITGTAPGELATMRMKTKGDIVRAGLNFGF